MIKLSTTQAQALNAKLLKVVPGSQALDPKRAYTLFTRALTQSRTFPTQELFVERGGKGECHWDVKAIMDDWRQDEKTGEATPDTRYFFCTGWACNIAGTWIMHSWVWVEQEGDDFIVDTTTDRHQAYYGIKLTSAEEQRVGNLIGDREAAEY